MGLAISHPSFKVLQLSLVIVFIRTLLDSIGYDQNHQTTTACQIRLELRAA